MASIPLIAILLGCQQSGDMPAHTSTPSNHSEAGMSYRLASPGESGEIGPTKEPVGFPDLPLLITTPSVNREQELVPTGVLTHTIQAGQTLTTVAEQYSITLQALQLANQIIDPNIVLIGRELVVPDTNDEDNPTRLQAFPIVFANEVIGHSVENRPIHAYVIGDGDHDVVIAAGIHGGYEWNTILLAHRFLTFFTVYGDAVPVHVKLHIIPSANPDGIAAVTGQEGLFAVSDVTGDTTVGRFNGNRVDLNRNWDCDWSPQGIWRDETVSGGEQPFSEPESRALRDYILQNEVETVIWLHSAAGLVIPSGCQNQNHSPSQKAAILYGEAAGYPVGGFTAYEITGDAGSWLTKQGIASMTVELSDHQNLEFSRNLRGLLALFEGIDTLYSN